MAAKRRALDIDFVKIAAPAFVQFAAEPLARLVDTAYLGRLGANALGGASVAIAAQYSVSKLYNDPLLRTTISLVAAQEGGELRARADAISTALLLALFVGVVQGSAFFVLAGRVLSLSCCPASSPMHASALAYLRVCSAGAPVATLWLATNGIFRGLGDTATPLVWALMFTAINAALDPLFIWRFGLGAAGAAAGTAIAQTIALFPLLITLQRKLRAEQDRAIGADADTDALGVWSARRQWPIAGLFIPPGGTAALKATLIKYVNAGSFVLLRSIAKISAYSVCAREAARLGAVASAAHNLCFQLGVATTQLCESIAIATQTLLARELGSATTKPVDSGREPSSDPSAVALAAQTAPTAAACEDASRWQSQAARHIVARGLTIGTTIASALSLVTLVNRRQVVAGLTTIPEVRAAATAVMPLVLVCQALKGLAYPVSGALMGALDWRASAVAMWCAQASSVLAVAVFSRGGAVPLTLPRLWAALAVLFAAQIAAGLVRIASRTGPWAILRLDPPPSSTAAPTARPRSE